MKKTNNPFVLRVQSGQLKGHALKMADSSSTRPSKAILKQSLFNTLAPILSDYFFIEVFAGTGSIGIEALSRGASKAFFIEKDLQAFEVLNENLQRLGAKIPALCFESFWGDSFEILPQLLAGIKNQKAILFFDPPFPTRQNFAGVYERCFELMETIDMECVVIFECLSEYKMPKDIKKFSIIKAKKFGKSSLVYYKFH